MPSLNKLKALKKLMQEQGLLKQISDDASKGDLVKALTIKQLHNPDLSSQEFKSILRKKGRYRDPYRSPSSLDDIINFRGGNKYYDPREAAEEAQKGVDKLYSREPYSHHNEGVREGWPIEIVDDEIPSGRLSRVSGADKDAAERLKAVKNYPSKNLEENQDFRDLVEHYKNYPELPVMEEAPELWNRVLESKTKEKFDKIKDQIKKKNSE